MLVMHLNKMTIIKTHIHTPPSSRCTNSKTKIKKNMKKQQQQTRHFEVIHHVTHLCKPNLVDLNIHRTPSTHLSI